MREIAGAEADGALEALLGAVDRFGLDGSAIWSNLTPFRTDSGEIAVLSTPHVERLEDLAEITSAARYLDEEHVLALTIMGAGPTPGSVALLIHAPEVESALPVVERVTVCPPRPAEGSDSWGFKRHARRQARRPGEPTRSRWGSRDRGRHTQE